MEEFFPSEIARLILGYLNEIKCKKSWQTLLEESSDLQEYFHLLKKGKVYPTNVNGKSLSDILAEYCVLKREALMKHSYPEERSNKLNDQHGISENAVEKIVKNALDLAFQKYLPSKCKCRTNELDNSVELIAGKSTKQSVVEKNINDGYRIGNDNNLNIQLNDLNQNVSLTLQPNITNVMSVTKSDYNSIDTVENELSTPSLLALKSVARLSIPINESSANFSNKVNSSICESSMSSLRSKSPDLLTVIKTEDDNDVEIISHKVVQSKNQIDVEGAIVLQKDCESRDSDVIIDGKSHNENMSSEPDKELSNHAEDKAASLEVINLELGDLIKFEANHDALNSNLEDNTVAHGNSNKNSDSNLNTQSSNCSNVTIQQVSPLNVQSSVVNTINSTNNATGFSITSNSISNQVAAISDISLSSVPTYFLSNFPSTGQIVQNSTPYQFVINSPVNGMSLTVPALSVNNVSNSVFSGTEPRKVNGTPQFVPISSSSNVPAIAPAKTNNNNSDISNVKGQECLKRKNKNEVLSERKKNNCSENSSKKTTNSCHKSEVLPERKKSKDSEDSSKKVTNSCHKSEVLPERKKSKESEDSSKKVTNSCHKSEVLPEKKKRIHSEESSKKTQSSCKKKEASLNKSNGKSKSCNVLTVEKEKRCYTRRSKKRRLISLYQPPDVSKASEEISTKENGILETSAPETDYDGLEESMSFDEVYYLRKLMH